MQKNQTGGSDIDSLTEMMFSVMKRLDDPTNDIDKEIKRSTAMTNAANVIVNAQKAKLDAAKLQFAMNGGGKSGKKELGNGKAD